MKRVTGSNHSVVNKGVSIQLKLGGHSFSPDTLPPVGEENDIRCELLTPKTLLIPREEFDATVAGKLLEIAGMPPAEDECTIWSESEETAVAVMAFGCEQIEALRKRFGDRLHFTSPLLFTPQCAPASVWLCRKEDLLYIKVYDDGLRFAEVVTIQTDADLLYYIELLNREFKFAQFELCPAGEIGGTAYKMLRRYFKNVRK